MLYESLVRRAEELSRQSMFDLPPLPKWQEQLPEKRRKWREMLGLDPLPERTPLSVCRTGMLKRGDLVIEKLHFQPLPGCRIAANIYRPKTISEPLPAVIYVCGHASRGKAHYQEHARWFGTHGYVAMILDAIQIGENRGFHHGTHRHSWWHWYSQGYSPASVEVWAAMRAADYLQSREDVDGERLGITGNSGGGTVSWFTGAADERFRVVAPSCQTGSMYQHIRDRTVDGHCDCTFWVNTYGWDFSDVASLIAPRPLLVAAATEDGLFRPYAFRDLVHRVRKLYIAWGREDLVDLVEAVSPHGYSPKTRLAIFSWFDRHLKDAEVQVTDDVSAEKENDGDLSVYAGQGPPSADRLNGVDRLLVPLPAAPQITGSDEWQQFSVGAGIRLRTQTFRQIPLTIQAPRTVMRSQGQSGEWRFSTLEFESEPGLPVRVHLAMPVNGPNPCPVVASPLAATERTAFLGAGSVMRGMDPTQGGYACVEVRGTGNTAIGPGLEWTLRRSYPLVGQTLWERRLYDFLTAIQVLRQLPNVSQVVAAGAGADAVLPIYAALVDEDIQEVVLHDPLVSHWDSGPEFLNVLQVGDLPVTTALICPRRLTFVGTVPEPFSWTRSVYQINGVSPSFRTVRTVADWTFDMP